MTRNRQSAYIEALMGAGAELFEVGGPVRDHILGRENKDRDVLVRHLPVKKLVSTLRPFGKVSAVGKSFGVIKFSPHQEPGTEIDIALPRKERSTGTGHRDFEVDFDPEIAIEEDLGRRDFTMNAMAMSLDDGSIIDPSGGMEDLKNKTLRMVFGNAFVEDPLRLLRGIQFAARFDLTIEEDTWRSMCENADLIKTVSPERIIQELKKLMLAPRPSAGFGLMLDSSMLKHILPELVAIRGIEQDKLPGDDVYMHTMRVLDAASGDEHVENKGDMDLLFAALLHDIGKAKTARELPGKGRIVFFGHQIVSARMAKKWMARMKVETAGIDPGAVLKLIENHMFETKSYFTDRAIRRFVAKIGPELVFKLLDLRLSDNRGGKHPQGIKGVLKLRKRVREEMAKKPPFGPKDLAVDGHDIMGLGIPEGPRIGLLMKALVESVLDEPELNTRDMLLALAREMMENPELLEKKIADAGKCEEEESERQVT
jgi:poly(A) polymerase/tRNA nucleotidyltransferase (CCA-adding enzyme)